MNEEKRKLDGMESSKWKEKRSPACMDDMRDEHNSNLSHDVACKS